MKRGFVLVVALASCGPHGVGSLLPRPTPPATGARCEPSASLPELDARFVPEVTGSLALVAARGDMRLSAPAGFVVAWSADSALVGFVRETDVTVWRVSDGTLVDRLACPGFANGASELAHSADDRWLAITHVGGTNRDISRACVVDRKVHGVQIIDVAVAHPRIEGGALTGDSETITLETGDVTTHAAPVVTPPASPWIDPPMNGVNERAYSHDGRYVALWYEPPAVLLGGGETAQAAQAFGSVGVTLVDRRTGTVVWKLASSLGHRWQFSPKDHFLEAPNGWFHSELVSVADGTVHTFPGAIQDVAPDDDHVIVHEPWPVVWSLQPMQRVLAPSHAWPVVARSDDGAVRAIRIGEELGIERDGTCVNLGVKPSPFEGGDPIALSPDARYLYLGHDGGATISTSTAYTWDTATGALVHATSVDGPVRIFPLAARAQFAFAARDGLRLIDARTGATTGTAFAPRASQGPFVNGVSHSVREVNGDRADHFSWRVVASSDGSHLVGLDDLGVSIWDLRDRTRVVDLPRSPLSDWIDPIAWSRDERWIAAGMRNGRIELWSRDGHAIAVAARHDDEVEELAFSRDGTALASSGKDGVVHVTDVATGDLFGSVTLVDDRALHLWWSPSQLVIDTARGFQIIVRRR